MLTLHISTSLFLNLDKKGKGICNKLHIPFLHKSFETM